MSAKTIRREPKVEPIGAYKTMGKYGPKYRVEKLQETLGGGKSHVSIVLIETGEKAKYPLSKVLQDPKA